jgi:hypothetical protein
MKPLIATLKTLFQCPFLWIFHIALIGIFIGIATSDQFYTATFTPIAILMFLFFSYGGMISSMVADILSKPFTFYLPGHMKMAQRMLFITWLSITVLFFLIVRGIHFNDFKTIDAFFIVCISLISLSYWAGVFILSQVGWLIILIPFLLFLSFLQLRYRMIAIEPMHVLPAHPWVVVFICSFFIFLIYRSVGRIENVRCLCTKPSLWLILSKGINRAPVNMNQYQRIDPTVQSIGSFFSERVSTNYNSRFLANLWGQVYLFVGPLITYRKIFWLQGLWFGIVFFFAFTGRLQVQGSFVIDLINFILVSLFSSLIFNHHGFNPFLLIGRREYFWRGMTILLISISIALAFMTLCIFLFNQFSRNSSPIDWIFLIVPIMTIPLFGGLIILLDKYDKVLLIISMVIAILISLGLSYWAVVVMKNTSFYIDLLIILFAAAITWGFHIAVLYYDSLKRSLC